MGGRQIKKSDDLFCFNINASFFQQEESPSFGSAGFSLIPDFGLSEEVNDQLPL